MSPKKTNVETRLNELEATVRGLTQELVDANERIRHLEAALDEEVDGVTDESRVLAPEQRNGADGDDEGGEDGAGGGTKHTSDDRQADEDDAGSDLDDIIVA